MVETRTNKLQMDDFNSHKQLRPYYDPDTFNAGYPSVFKPDQGVVDPHGFTIASKLNIVASSKMGKAGKKIGENGMLSSLTTGIKHKVLKDRSLDANAAADEARKSLSDLEFGDLINWKTWKVLVSNMLTQFVKRYFQHLVQQPFEVARLLLQVGEFDLSSSESTDELRRQKIELEVTDVDGFEGSYYDENDNEDDEIDYFPSTNAQNRNTATTKEFSELAAVTHKIKPQSLHTMDIMNSVMDEEGTRGLWRANNTTFIYNFLSATLDAWFTGMLSPFLQIPDPYFIDIIHSPDPQKSIALTLAASVFTGIALLPLDLIKTRLTITSVRKGERSFRKLLKRWSWRVHTKYIPLDMLLLNVAYSLTTTAFTRLTGVLLYRQLNIDKYTRAVLYNTLKFASRVTELFVKLPLENLLRRSQVAYLVGETRRNPFFIDETDDALIVKPKAYRGFWNSLRDTDKLHELWRGWRLGLMSVVCGYGLKMMDRNSEGLEEEKF